MPRLIKSTEPICVTAFVIENSKIKAILLRSSRYRWVPWRTGLDQTHDKYNWACVMEDSEVLQGKGEARGERSNCKQKWKTKIGDGAMVNPASVLNLTASARKGQREVDDLRDTLVFKV